MALVPSGEGVVFQAPGQGALDDVVVIFVILVADEANMKRRTVFLRRSIEQAKCVVDTKDFGRPLLYSH